jgi:hypothetical protein
MSNYDTYITNISILKWMKPHSLHHAFFRGKLFSLDDPKKIQFDSYKGFCEKKGTEIARYQRIFFKKILKAPCLDNRFSVGHQIF